MQADAEPPAVARAAEIQRRRRPRHLEREPPRRVHGELKRPVSTRQSCRIHKLRNNLVSHADCERAIDSRPGIGRRPQHYFPGTVGGLWKSQKRRVPVTPDAVRLRLRPATAEQGQRRLARGDRETQGPEPAGFLGVGPEPAVNGTGDLISLPGQAGKIITKRLERLDTTSAGVVKE